MPRLRMIAHPDGLERRPKVAGVTIRPLTESDSAAATTVLLAGYEGTSESEPDDDQELVRFFTSEYGPPIREATFLAEDSDGNAVGISLVCKHEGDPLLAHVVVTPSWQGRGLAGQLIHASASGLRSVSDAALNLAVGSGNQPALRTYARLGFAIHTETCVARASGVAYVSGEADRAELLEERDRIVPQCDLNRSVQVTVDNKVVHTINDPLVSLLFAMVTGEYTSSGLIPIRAAEIDAVQKLLRPFGTNSAEMAIAASLEPFRSTSPGQLAVRFESA